VINTVSVLAAMLVPTMLTAVVAGVVTARLAVLTAPKPQRFVD